MNVPQMVLSGKTLQNIRVGEVHRLLEYWRGRIAHGLSGLIWVQNSPLFQDQDDGHDHGQRFREAIEQPHYESDEEVFVLPQSDDIEEDKYESNDNQQHPYRSSQGYPSFEGCHGGSHRCEWDVPIQMDTSPVSAVCFYLTWAFYKMSYL